nr:AraC family transcriptional regulator [Herbaspirillum sp. ST 5-3]
MQTLSTHDDPLTYDSFIESTILDVLCRFGGLKAQEIKHTSIGLKITDITDYVDANLDQPLKVEDLAEVAEFSRFHFIRCFRNVTGVTPIAFVQARRAMKAKQLLTAGHCPSMVAVQTGFADQSHMNRWLKACYGTTSKMFKKAI